jgi:hypothetical protein
VNPGAMLTPLAPLALCVLCVAGSAAAAPLHDVHVEGGRFVDSVGRERLFRGINVVYKDPPWLPTATSFNANFSFV